MPKLEYYSGSAWVPVGTISSITAGNGLSGGTITSTGTISLANTTVTAGTYVIPTVTVNAQGQITSATSIGSGAANQILQTNGTSLFWGKYLSSPSIGSFCLTESNKTFSGVQNTAFGDSALNANTTGYYNTSVGNYALNKVTSGYRNTAVGAFALLNNVIGNNNCAFGESSLLWNTGSNNSAFGNNALSLNTSGYYNVAVGNESLSRNTTGYRNVAVGYSSLLLCSTGDSNTAVGDLASYNTTTGYSNTSVGASSLYTMSTGYDNCSFGALSLYFTTSGYQNCSFGRSALYANTTGYQNSAFGFVSLSSNTTGNNNTAVGQNALSTNTTGSNNTAVGYAANVSASGLSNATSIGAYSVCGTSNAIVLGGSSSINNVYYPNIGIGQNSPSYSLHIGNTQQTPVASIGIENTTNTPSALTGGAVIYASGGDLYAVTLNSGTQKIGASNNLGTVTSVSVSGSTGITISGSPITSSGTITLTLNSQLQGLSSLASNGLVTRTASGVYTGRTLTSGTGISISNSDGVSGNPTISCSTQLQNLHNLNSVGFVSLTSYSSGASSFATRTLTAGTGISITDGVGGTGNPTISLNSNVLFLSNTSNSANFICSLNNTNTLATATGFSFKENATDRGQVGVNNSTNELYLWAINSTKIKLGTENTERFTIDTTGKSKFSGIVEIGGSSIYNATLLVNRNAYTNNMTDPALYLRGYYNSTGSYYNAVIDPARYVHSFGQVTYTRGSKVSLVMDSDSLGEGSSIAMNGDYIQLITPFDDLGIIFTDEDTASGDSYLSYISSSGSLVVSSSTNKKYSIKKKEHKNYLERINKLNVYSYAYKCNINDEDNLKIKDRKYFKAKRLNVGFIADEVDQLFDNCTDKYKLIDINEDNLNDFDGMIKSHTPSIDEKDFVEEKNKNRDGPGIKYDSLLCYTVLALQELSRKVDQYINKGK